MAETIFPSSENSRSTTPVFNHLPTSTLEAPVHLISSKFTENREVMKIVLGEIKGYAEAFWQNKPLRKRVGWGLAVFLVLQLYFVRELIAAELLFGILFLFLFALASLAYAVGTIGMNGRSWAEAGARVVATSARRGYSALEEISKKPFRHPHSESAQ
jgi:hypothetical protein